MNSAKIVSGLMLLAALSGCSTLAFKEPKEIPIEAVVRQVQLTLNQVARKSSNLSFTSAELTLETIIKDATSTSVKFWVISSEGVVSEAVTQSLYFKLVPKPIGAVMEVNEQLSEAILSAATDMEKALAGGALVLDQLAATVKFTVEASGTDGASYELVPVTIGAKKSRTQSAGHTIKLAFMTRAAEAEKKAQDAAEKKHKAKREAEEAAFKERLEKAMECACKSS